MCRVTRTGVDLCTYSNVLKYGCISRDKERARVAKEGTTWSIPIRPSLKRQNATLGTIEEASNGKEGNPRNHLGEEEGHNGGPEL